MQFMVAISFCLLYNLKCKEDNLQMNKANERKYRVMTRTELEKIAKDYTTEHYLRIGERIVDVNADNEMIFYKRLVFVLVVTKFHTVLKYALWIDNESGEVDDSYVDVKVLD